jgi:hypothetical protein
LYILFDFILHNEWQGEAMRNGEQGSEGGMEVLAEQAQQI